MDWRAKAVGIANKFLLDRASEGIVIVWQVDGKADP